MQRLKKVILLLLVAMLSTSSMTVSSVAFNEVNLTDITLKSELEGVDGVLPGAANPDGVLNTTALSDSEETDDESSAYFDSLVTYRDVIYKTTEFGQELKLDILMPTNDVYGNRVPVVMFVAGSGWINEINREALVVKGRELSTAELLERGYAFVTIEHRLCNGLNNGFTGNVTDVKDAVRWIRANSNVYGFDPNNIGIEAASAGAHLSLLAAYTADDAFIGDEALSAYSSEVNYIVDINAPMAPLTVDDLDSLTIAQRIEFQAKLSFLFTRTMFLSNLSEEDISVIDSVNVLHRIGERNVPTLVFHGTADTTVDIQNSSTFVGALQNAGIECVYKWVEGAEHGLVGGSDSDLQEVAQMTVDFITDHYQS